MAKKPDLPRGATRKETPKKQRAWRINLGMGKIAWRYAISAFFAALILIVAVYAAQVAYRNWPIQDVQFNGQLNVWNVEAIGKKLDWVTTESFLSLDVEQVRKTLEALPLIAQARVSKRWPGVVVIQIVEDVPVAIWNKEYLLSASGRLSTIPEGLAIDELTTMQGATNQTQIAVQYFRRVQQLLNAQAVKVKGLKISPVGSVEVMLDNGWRVEFGRQYIEDRIVRLEQLLRYLPQEKVRTIDLRYGKGAAVSWRSEEMG